MRLKTLRQLLMLAVTPVCAAASLMARSADTDSRFVLPLQFAGTAHGQAAAAGKSFGFTVYSTDRTSDQQVKDYTDTLRENDPDGLAKAFDKTKDVGRVPPMGLVGNSFRFARATLAAKEQEHSPPYARSNSTRRMNWK